MGRRWAEGLLTAMVAWTAGCGGGAPKGNPTPVGVVDPAKMPNLNINAFLLSNGTAIGCDEFVNVAAVKYANQENLKLADPGGPANKQSHDEPAIGGGDGSFRLNMAVQKNLAGSGAATLKFCGVKHDDKDGTWKLKWKIWNLDGSDSDEGERMLDLPNRKEIKIDVHFNDASQLVTIARTTDTYGSAWQAKSKQANFKVVGPAAAFGTGDVTTSELDAANSTSLRMVKLEITETPTGSGSPITDSIPLDQHAVPGKTCAGFVICHDANCPDIPVPTPCAK